MTRGIVYFVIGQKYLAHAAASLDSLRRFHPDMEATVFCNDSVATSFDHIARYESVNDQYPANEIFLDRIRCMAQSPYDRTLFLDADTYVDGPLDQLFRLLDAFDIAVRQSDVGITSIFDDVPHTFPEHNCGALLWKWNAVTRQLFADWEKEMVCYIQGSGPGVLRGHNAHSDQVPFRHVLYRSDARIATLQDNYLCQVGAGGLLRGRAIILHGGRDHMGLLAKVAALINKNQPHIDLETGLPIGSFGTFRYHCRMGSVVEVKSGRGLLPDDEWGRKRKELIGA